MPPISNASHAAVLARLDRHAVRRDGGVPTVSVLVGPVGASRRAWTDWTTHSGHHPITARGRFPLADWLSSAGKLVPLPVAAVQAVARRIGRDPEELLAEWRAKTRADRERFWETVPPHPDNDILQASSLLSDAPPVVVAKALAQFGDRAAAVLVRLCPGTVPGVMWIVGSVGELSAVAAEASGWAVRVPTVPLALAVPAVVWAEYLRTAPDGRAKAILREGEVEVVGLEPAEAERLLTVAGVSEPVRAALTTRGADEAVVTAAVQVAQATAAPLETEAADAHARSAAEAFLFRMLESLPETAGRFELNGELDFPFGPRLAEVDLLCRELRLAVEIDGYWHFGNPVAYRRDRTKDWELQRRGIVVLRFLATDVLPRFEEVRDRILDAVRTLPPGGAE